MNPRKPVPLDYARKREGSSPLDPTEIVVTVVILLFLVVVVVNLFLGFRY